MSKTTEQFQNLINEALEQKSIHEFRSFFAELMKMVSLAEEKSELTALFDRILDEKLTEKKLKPGMSSSPRGIYRIFEGNDALLYYLFLFFPYENNIHLAMNGLDAPLLWKVFEKGISPGRITVPERENPYSEDEIFDILDMLNAEFDYSEAIIGPNDTILILDDTFTEYGTSFFRAVHEGTLASTIILPVPSETFRKKGISDSDLLFHELGNDVVFKYSEGKDNAYIFKELPLALDEDSKMTAGIADAIADMIGFALNSVTPYRHLPEDMVKVIGENRIDQEDFYGSIRETVRKYIKKIKMRWYRS